MDLLDPRHGHPATVGAPKGQDGASADADLVAAVVAGDESAFLSLVERWSPALAAVAVRLTGRPASAHVLVRGAWRRALEAARAYREPPGLRVLLIRALLDEARATGVLTAPAAAYQRLGVGPTVGPGKFLPADDPAWPGHWARPPQPWPDAAGSVEAGPAFESALAALPEPQRVVVALRDCGGCQVEEISRTIAVSTGQARNLLHRARAALRAALEESLPQAV
jgi:RNA polymerase sigma-70 factor (ECF subfamily)